MIFLRKHSAFICIIMLCAAVTLFNSCDKEQVCHTVTSVTAKSVFSIKEIKDTLILTDTSAIDTTIISYRDTLLATPTMATFSYDSNFIITGLNNISTMPFSLDPDLETIQYIVTPDANEPDSTDTLTVNYQSELHFISNDCGFTYYYDLVSASITKHHFDSVAITENEVTIEGNKRHIRLYFYK